MPIDWRPFTKLVNEAQSFVLTSHMRPDCDAIGSEIGLALALRSLGKTVRIVNGDPVPPHIGFIDPNHDVQVLGRDVAASDLTCDVHAVLDTSAWTQLGPMADVVRKYGRAEDQHRPSCEPGRHGRRGVQGYDVANRPAGSCCRRSMRSA